MGRQARQIFPIIATVRPISRDRESDPIPRRQIKQKLGLRTNLYLVSGAQRPDIFKHQVYVRRRSNKSNPQHAAHVDDRD